MLSLDTETTGLDVYHGARPFFVTTCAEDGTQRYWEWDVDPHTRAVRIPEEDAREIRQLLAAQDGGIVLQNAKFDAAALYCAEVTDWTPLWDLTHDTILMGHLLASNQPHDLTAMATQYLGVNIQPYEDALEVAVKAARNLCRSRLPEWRIAKRGDDDMPSAKEKTWKYDSWLPRALVVNGAVRERDHPTWLTVLRDYANADSSVTVALYGVMRKEIERRGLWEIYLERLKLLPIAHEMEREGVTLSKDRLEQLRGEYREESERAACVCVNLAESYGYNLELPKGAVNGSLRTFCFEVMKLRPIVNPKAKTSNPCLDAKVAIPWYQANLRRGSRELAFINALVEKRSRDTAVSYLTGYERFMLPHDGDDGWYVLHPSLNMTGTDTLRWSSSNPNEQNISKREGFNLRYCFGPAPGREWWSMDAQNIELRIPAFEAGEEELVNVFLRPKDPPYYGSYHLVVFDALHPAMFAKYGVECKTEFESTWYQWVKNFNFAVIYGAQEKTADQTARVEGAYRKVRDRFPKIAKLSDKQKAYADRHGYVETIPDKSVNPKRGYPLLCSRSESGHILPTTPLNYHVSGTAMQWMNKAMTRCQPKLDEWRQRDGFDGRIVLQVHDELVFDLPKSGDPVAESKMRGGKGPLFRATSSSNLWRIRILQKLMEMGGEDIGVPTPVSVEYHPHNWSEGVTL